MCYMITETKGKIQMSRENGKTEEMRQKEKFMRAALREAKKAYALDEVPIGCVIEREGKIIARGYNRRNTDKNVLAHAELAALKKASKKTGDWRLEDCTMYVTLEPCQMCAGALVQARLKKGGHRNHESQGRVRRIGAGSSACGEVQSSGGDGERHSGGGVCGHALRIFRAAPGAEKE